MIEAFKHCPFDFCWQHKTAFVDKTFLSFFFVMSWHPDILFWNVHFFMLCFCTAGGVHNFCVPVFSLSFLVCCSRSILAVCKYVCLITSGQNESYWRSVSLCYCYFKPSLESRIYGSTAPKWRSNDSSLLWTYSWNKYL